MKILLRVLGGVAYLSATSPLEYELIEDDNRIYGTALAENISLEKIQENIEEAKSNGYENIS